MWRLFAALTFAACVVPSTEAVSKKNVLLLIADDLRPQLNKAYGHDFMVTPNLDKFADQALVFDRAYCNFAICSASRNSFMTGRVPDKTRTWNFINHFRQAGLSSKGGAKGKDWISLPQLFKMHNYTVLGHGKTYHPQKPPNNDEPLSWSQEQDYVSLSTSYCHFGKRFCPGIGKNGLDNDAAFSDYNTTMTALETLRTYANAAKPWFIALGLHFPHQPWATPQWAVEKYPDPTTLPAALHQDAPTHCPAIAFTAELDGVNTLTMDESNPILAQSAPANVSDLTTFPCPSPGNNTVPEWFQQQLRVGYYSAVTHSDWLFGMMLDELDALGATNDTLVILTGDHGWQLGEHGEWGKHTNFDLAVHVPLLIRAPWKANSVGQHTESATELVDLYRTVVSLAGLPQTAVADDVDGTDVSALLDDPTTSLKDEAYAQYSRCPGNRFWPDRIPDPQGWDYNNCESVPSENITAMGYTVRTTEWRFTEWFAWDGLSCSAQFERGATYGVELYSHSGEVLYPVNFDGFENENLASNPANDATVKYLHRKLLARFDVKADLGCPPKPKSAEVFPSLEL